jgi:hypothetical protein
MWETPVLRALGWDYTKREQKCRKAKFQTVKSGFSVFGKFKATTGQIQKSQYLYGRHIFVTKKSFQQHVRCTDLTHDSKHAICTINLA